MYFSITKYHVYNMFTIYLHHKKYYVQHFGNAKHLMCTVFLPQKMSYLQYFGIAKYHVYNIFYVTKIYCIFPSQKYSQNVMYIIFFPSQKYTVCNIFTSQKILYTMFSYHKNIMYYSIFTSQKYHPARPFILNHRLTQYLVSASFCCQSFSCTKSFHKLYHNRSKKTSHGIFSRMITH